MCMYVRMLTASHQLDLPADGGQVVACEAAHGQVALQVTKHHLALQVVVLVQVGLHRHRGGVGLERLPLGRLIGTAGGREEGERE